MSDADFEQFIEGCKIAFRCRLVTPKSGIPYYQVDLKKRREFFIFLFSRLEERVKIKGISVRDFLSSNKKAILIEECIAHGDHITANKKRYWVKGTTRDINSAIEYLFPEDYKVKNFEDIPTPKVEEYQPPIEEAVVNSDEQVIDVKTAPTWNAKKFREENGITPMERIVDPEIEELLGFNRKK